jgi:phosphoketolase
MKAKKLFNKDELKKIDAYWRAANYLSVGQICLLDNPLLKEPLVVRRPIHRLLYRRTNHKNVHVHGYKEEGTTTTPFDMTVLNELDRFNLADDVIDRVARLQNQAAHVKDWLHNKLIEHKQYITTHGEDMPEIRNWKWLY